MPLISRNRCLAAAALCLASFLGPACLQAAPIIPSPSDDLLLSSNGGVADINGSTTDGAANYNQLPAANLNDGNRDGFYNNGAGVDGAGSIAHSSSAAANNEMGVTLATPAFFATVNIFNRTDCCGDRLDAGGTLPFTLNIFDGPDNVFSHTYTFNATISQTTVNPSNMATETASGMVITTDVVGTYVQVVQANPTVMNLAEIEAFAPEPASVSLLGLGSLGLLVRRR